MRSVKPALPATFFLVVLWIAACQLSRPPTAAPSSTSPAPTLRPSPTSVPARTAAPTPSPTPRPTQVPPTPVPRTWRNAPWGYELTYTRGVAQPTEWNLYTDFEGGSFGWMRLEVESNARRLPLDQWMDAHTACLPNGPVSDPTPVMLGEKAGVQVVWHDRWAGDHILVAVGRDTIVYLFTIVPVTQGDYDPAEILSSFRLRFIEPKIMLPAEAEQAIGTQAQEVIQAIAARNWAAVATYVHPDKGLLFAPYCYMDPQSGLTFSADQVRGLWSDPTSYLWGGYDGSGEPIQVPLTGYYRSFIYDRDFANAADVGYNLIIGRGNTYNNQFEVYPDAVVVEYYTPPSQCGGLDWASLRLIFQEKDGVWYLVAIVHDEWTI